jgi:hypothetical protein
MKKIKDVVGNGRVLADASHGIVRGWCENPGDGRTLRSLRKFFPDAEEYGHGLVRLGGFRRFAGGEDSLVAALADAKMKSHSNFIQSLHLFETDGEGMQTIIKAGLLT